MPLSTPSPHRFLAAPPSSQKTKPKPKPPSGLRHATQAADIEPETATPKPTPARRFVISTPKTTQQVARSDHSHGDAWVRPTLPATPRPRPALQKIESIEESSAPDSTSSSEGDAVTTTELKAGEREVVDLTNDGDAMDVSDDAHDEEKDEDAEMLFTPLPEHPHKRRRISVSPQPSPPGSPTRNQQDLSRPCPHAPQVHIKTGKLQLAHASLSHSHRFLLPASRAAAISTTAHTPAPNTPVPNRPHFLLPSGPTSATNTSTTAASTPRPDIFSPSRKGQKYISGGVASTLQSWILEEASTGYMAQAQLNETSGAGVVWGRDREDGVETRIRLDGIRGSAMDEEEGMECIAGGVTFGRGYTTEDEQRAMDVDGHRMHETQVLLVGTGGMRGRGRGTGQRPLRLKSGDSVGIRAPTWSVHVEGSEWRVGVDWLLL